MSRCGDMYENRVTGERCVVLRGSEDRGDGNGFVHLRARPGAAVIGEHVHPAISERFTVVSGRLCARLDGEVRELGPGEEGYAAAGMAHDWWNASSTAYADVLVELSEPEPLVDPDRFELLICTLFGLANDGRVDGRGRPNPLQAALIFGEFDDVVRFTKPPRLIQRLLVALCTPIARLAGYRAIYPEYCGPHGRVEPDPRMLAAARLVPEPAATEASAGAA